MSVITVNVATVSPNRPCFDCNGAVGTNFATHVRGITEVVVCDPCADRIEAEAVASFGANNFGQRWAR